MREDAVTFSSLYAALRLPFEKISNLPFGKYFEGLLLWLKIWGLEVSPALNEIHLVPH